MATGRKSTPLTAEEIEERFGWFIRTALDAFKNDSTYLADMVEQARAISWRQELLVARKLALADGCDPADARVTAHEALADQGIYPPARVSRPRSHSVV